MTHTKRIIALMLSLLMLVPVSAFVGINASAIAGGGIQQGDNLYFGCDLSFWNVDSSGYSEADADYSLVNFKKMKADGCDFAILRLGSEDSDGRYYDDHFVTYYNMAREAGMALGLYYYSYALTYAEAAADAEFVMQVIEQYDMYFEYPIYLDVEEEDQMALSSSALSSMCLGWCETLEANGYFPGLYGNYDFYEDLSYSVVNTYDTWIAWVSSATSVSIYDPWTYNLSDECGMWQYSFYGYEYDGIGLDMLDVNVAYKDYPAIMTEYGYNNCAPKEIIPLDGTLFWVTHYNNIEVEGSGSIMTEAYTGGEWNIHVAFAPTADGKYEITAISDGTVAGKGTPLAVPEGGFVYTINQGNDWPTLCEQYPDLYADYVGLPDYTNAFCDTMLATVRTWSVGDSFTFTNLNLDTQRVPTNTPTIKWYNDGYDCYAGYYVEGEAPDVSNDVSDDASDDVSDETSSDESYGATVDGNGDYTFENAYGYVFELDSDGTIDGEDNIIVTPDEYASANGWWAISVQLRPTANDSEYEVVAVGQGIGSNPSLDLASDDVVLIAHSAYSNPNGDNWMSKVAALALKEGDVLYLNGSTMTVLSPVVDDPSIDDSSDDSSDDTSDNTSDDPSVDPDPEIMRGDVDGNGVIDQYDYLLVKRAYFETYTLDEAAQKRADVDQSGEVDQMDYLFIKRHYFETYVIQ